MSDKVTKLDTARAIFADVTCSDEIERPRQEFLAQAQEAGLSERCASTYYQMLKRESQGQDMYAHHKHRKAKAGASVKVTSKAGKADMPWGVFEKSSGKLVATAKNRDEARAVLRDKGGASAGLTASKR